VIASLKLIFLLYIIIVISFTRTQPILIRDVSAVTIFLSLIFIIWNRKSFRDLNKLLFFLCCIAVLLYYSITGMMDLPDSFVVRQKLYLRFLYYLSLIILFYFFRKDTKRILIFFFIIFACTCLFFTWAYYISPLKSIPLLLFASLFIFDFFEFRKEGFLLLAVVVLAIIITLSVSTLLSYNISNTLPHFFYFTLGLIIFLYSLNIRDREIKIKILQYSVFFSVITCSILIIYILSYKDLNLFNKSFLSSIGGFQVNSIGSMLSVSVPILLGYVLFLEKTYKKYILAFFIIIALYILFQTHSRASIIAIVFSSLFILIYFGAHRKKIHFKTVITTLIFLTAALIFFSLFLHDYIIVQLQTDSLQTRIIIWESFIKRTANESLIFGFGPGNSFINYTLPLTYLKAESVNVLRAYVNSTRDYSHAHNLFVQIFFDFGLMGITTILFFGAVTIRLMIKSVSRKEQMDPLQIITVAVLISLLIQELFDYTIPDPVTFFPAVIFTGFLFSFLISDIQTNIIKNEFHTPIKKAIDLFRVLVLVILFPVCLILSYNYYIFNMQQTLMQNNASIDNFNNIKFSDRAALDPYLRKRFLFLDRLYLPIYLDEKRAAYSGGYLLKLKKLKLFKNTKLINSRFRECIKINKYSAYCHRGLAVLKEMEGKTREAEKLVKKSKILDPFHLTNPRF